MSDDKKDDPLLHRDSLGFDPSSEEMRKLREAGAMGAEPEMEYEGTECPYCGEMVHGVHAEVAHMNAMHPDIVRERLEKAGLVASDRSMYGFNVVDDMGNRVDPRSIEPSEEYVADYRTGPDLPSFLTLGELQMVLMFAMEFAVEQNTPAGVNKTIIGIQVRDRGAGSTLPASWIEFSVGDKDYAFWRNTMDLYEVHDGAVGEDPIHRND